jgi:hypothetical protein
MLPFFWLRRQEYPASETVAPEARGQSSQTRYVPVSRDCRNYHNRRGERNGKALLRPGSPLGKTPEILYGPVREKGG